MSKLEVYALLEFAFECTDFSHDFAVWHHITLRISTDSVMETWRSSDCTSRCRANLSPETVIAIQATLLLDVSTDSLIRVVEELNPTLRDVLLRIYVSLDRGPWRLSSGAGNRTERA